MKYTEEQRQLAISYLERRSKITSLETGIAPEAVMKGYFNMLEIVDGFTMEQLVAAVEKWDDWTMPIYWAYSRKHRIAERYRKMPRR